MTRIKEPFCDLFGKHRLLIYAGLSPRSSTRSIVLDLLLTSFFVRYYFTTFIELYLDNLNRFSFLQTPSFIDIFERLANSN